MNNTVGQYKRMYSFLQPNQYRKSFYDYKKKNLVNKHTKLFKSFKSRYSFLFVKTNMFLFKQLNDCLNYYDNPQKFNYSTGEYPKKYSSLPHPVIDYHPIPNYTIPRIKFKPGYQRIWRIARTTLKEFLSKKFIYQQQLTKYLRRYYRLAGAPVSNHIEKSLGRTILYSRLLPDEATIKFFNSKSFIYFNGNVNLNLDAITLVGDCIQFIVSFSFYASHK